MGIYSSPYKRARLSARADHRVKKKKLIVIPNRKEIDRLREKKEHWRYNEFI